MMRAQDGDQRAYTALLTSITPYLRALARRALADQADIEEAVQDTLLTIHQIRHSYEPDRPLAPWIATIARRRFVDRIRTNARQAARRLAVAEAALLMPGDESGATEEYDTLFKAIETLPQAQKQAIELLKLRELSLKEAAAVTGKTVGALKTTTFRAVRTLRTALAAETGT